MGADVYEYKENTDEGSVRFGLMDNKYLKGFDSVEEAQQSYPGAEVRHDKIRGEEMPPMPPSDFDTGYAGERWDDDY